MKYKTLYQRRKIEQFNNVSRIWIVANALFYFRMLMLHAELTKAEIDWEIAEQVIEASNDDYIRSLSPAQLLTGDNDMTEFVIGYNEIYKKWKNKAPGLISPEKVEKICKLPNIDEVITIPKENHFGFINVLFSLIEFMVNNHSKEELEREYNFYFVKNQPQMSFQCFRKYIAELLEVVNHHS